MSRDSDNYNFGNSGGESDPLGGLLADVRPPVEPMSSERSQQIFRDALQQSGVTPRKSVRFGNRLWFAVSLPAGALAGAAILAILAQKSPDTTARFKAPDKYVHTGISRPDTNLPPAPHHYEDVKPLTPPKAIKHLPVVRKDPPRPVIKRPNRLRVAQVALNHPTVTLARLEFVRNDVLVTRFADEPTTKFSYAVQDGQPVRSDTVLLRYDTQSNNVQVEPVTFAIYVSKGSERGFAKASSAVLDDAGQMQRKYCTVRDDKEAQNVTATTMIGDRSAGEGSLALTVRFTLDRPGKGETKNDSKQMH